MARERNCDKKNCMILYSRHKGGKDVFGTVFYIIRYVMDNLLDFEPLNERICKLRLNLNITI